MIGAGLRMLVVGAEIGGLGADLPRNATRALRALGLPMGAEPPPRRVPAEDHMLGS
jgi:hypothetical protein